MAATRRDRAPRPRPYHHGDLRRALIDAAVELSVAHGIGSVSLREIARKVGVSQTAPYRHFRDLEQLVATASEDGQVALRLELARAFAEGAGERPLVRLERFLGAYVRFAVRHRGHFRLMFGPGSPHPSVTPTLGAAARDTFQLFLTKVEAAWPRPPPNGISARAGALQLWAIGHGVATLAIDGRAAFLGLDASTAEELATRMVRAQLAGIVARSNAAKRKPATRRKKAARPG